VVTETESFPFKLFIAGDIPPHDWHPEGSINYVLCAKIYGTPALLDFRVVTIKSLRNELEVETLPSYSAVPKAYLDLPCNIEVRQSMTAVYDPKPDDGFSDLDIQGGGDISGLGIYKLIHYSSLVSYNQARIDFSGVSAHWSRPAWNSPTLLRPLPFTLLNSH